MIHNYYRIFMDNRTGGSDRLSWVVVNTEKWLDREDSPSWWSKAVR